MGTLRRGLLLLFAALLLGGCARTLRIEVYSTPESNGRRPLYMMVRQVDDRPAGEGDYGVLAELLFSRPRDPSVLATRLVRPGESPLVLSLEPPDDAKLELCFFFTDYHPEQRWFVAVPEAASEIQVQLGSTQVVEPTRWKR